VYGTGQSPGEVTAADLNHDGYADLLVPDTKSDTVHIFLNQTNGAFASTSLPVPPGAEPFVVAAADFNRDHSPDFVVADYHEQATLFLGKGDGTFDGGTDYAAPGVVGAFGIVARDLTHDSYPDIVLVGYDSQRIDVLVNDAAWVPTPGALEARLTGMPNTLIGSLMHTDSPNSTNTPHVGPSAPSGDEWNNIGGHGVDREHGHLGRTAQKNPIVGDQIIDYDSALALLVQTI
jgi:hypothetical protein